MRVCPKDIVKLPEIIYDAQARDGTWCKLPYPNHPQGCPNFPQCISKYPDFKILPIYEWFAILEEFDLATHVELMKRQHPKWSESQCRNLLYWQNGVRKRLKEKIYSLKQANDIVLEIPEACGINVFATLSQVGIFLQRHKLNYVIKTMFLGKLTNQSRLLEEKP